MRPIDADALLTIPYVRKVTEFDETGCGISFLAVKIDDIYNFPHLDYTPLKHGEWKVFMLNRGDRQYVDSDLTCSVCSHRFVRLKGMQMFNYCPNCGSKMDGGKEPQ